MLKIALITRLILIAMILAASDVASQAVYQSAADGDWDDVDTWTLVTGPDGDVDGIPDGNDNVTILNGHRVRLDNGTDAACNNLTMQGTAEVDINEANLTLTVNGTMTMNGNSTVVAGASGIRLLHLLGPFIIPTGQIGTFDNVDVTQTPSQSFTILGEFLSTSQTGDKSIGNVFINSGGTSTGRWIFEADETWNVNSLTIYDGPVGQAIIDEDGGTGQINVAGNFSIIATTPGQKSKLGELNLTVTGTTSVSGWLLFTTNDNGDKRFNNTITVSTTGTWDNEVGEDPFINCSIVNNGSWPVSTGGASIYTVQTVGPFTYSGTGTTNMGRLRILLGTVTNLHALNLVGDTNQGLQVGNTATFINGNGAYLTFPCTGDAVNLFGGGAGVVNFSTVANTVEYNLTGAQNVFATTYHKLVCSNSGVKSQSAGTVTVNSELNIASNSTIYAAGTNTLNGPGNLVMTGSSELRLAKTLVDLPELTGTSNSLGAGSSINLSGINTQTLKSNTTFPYQDVAISGGAGSAVSLVNVGTILGNLTVTSQGAITAIPPGGLTVVGTYNTNSGGTANITAGNLTVGSIVIDGGGTLNYTGRTITVNGNGGAWANDGINTITTNASSLVTFTTGTGQQIGGTSATTFPNLTISNNNNVTLNTVNPTVTGTLNLITGNVITGSNRIIAPTVTRTSGFVQGNLQKPVATGTNVAITYELGTGTTYAPVTLVFASVSASGTGFMAGETSGDHPQILSANIEPSATVNRYYTLMRVGTLNFTTLSATLNFVAGDIDAGFSPDVDAAVKGYYAVTDIWKSAPVGVRTTTSTEFINAPYSNFANNEQVDIQIGRRIIVTGYFNRLTGTRDWHSPATWINNRDGTINVTNNSVNVTGTGTFFLLQLTAGDQLVLQSAAQATPFTVQSITSNTALVLTAPYSGTTTSGGYGRLKVPNTSSDSVVVGNPQFTVASGFDAATTIELTANATVHTLAINEPPNGRTTSQVVTHIGTSQLTALNVNVNQPTGNTTDSWNINAGTALVSGDLSIASANSNNNRIAQVNVTSGTLTIGGDLFFRTSGAGSQVTAVLTVGTGRVNLAGQLQSIGNRATLSMGASGVFNFNGTAASQAVDLPGSNPASFVFSNVECNNTSAGGAQLVIDITSTNLTGNFRVLTGKFQMSTTNNANLSGGATRTFELANGATLEMVGNGSQTFPSGFQTYTIGNTSTVIYGQTGNLTLPTTPSSYGHLTILDDPNYTLPNAAITVNGNLTIGDGTSNPDLRGTTATTLNVTGNISISANASITANNIATINLQGNWTNNGTFTPGAGTTSVVFGGNGATQPQTINGTSADTFYRLTLNTNDDTDLVRLSKNISVSNLLTLTRGGLELNGNQLAITSATSGAIVRTSPGYIKSETTASPYSRLQRAIGTATGLFVYPFGKSEAVADYVPFILNVTGAGTGAGTFEVSTYATAANNTPFPSGVTDVTSGTDASGGQVVDRFWILTRAGFTATPTADLTFTVTTGEAAGIAGDLRAQRWTVSNVWETAIPGQTNPTATSVTVPGVTTLSPWTLASHLTPLPIELLTFEARPANGVVQLTWETATEINNEYFDVERSQNGEEFVSVGRISGAGNSHSRRAYAFSDTYPLAGKAYYRLRQIDYDGKSSYSWVVKVETAMAFTIMAWPNPSDGSELNINWRDGVTGALISVRLWTQTGAKAFEGEVALDESHNSRISFASSLSPGVYILEAKTDSGVQRVKVAVK